MDRQLVFLLYANRSGSTFLAARLAAVERVSVTIESEFVGRLAARGDLAGAAASEIAAFLEEEPKFRAWEIPSDRLVRAIEESPQPFGLAGVVRAVLGCDPRHAAADYVVVKSPGVHRHLGALRAAFPQAKYLHIVRDPRAVYESQRRSISSRSGRPMAADAVSAALRWREVVRNAQSLAGPALLELRYEDLVLHHEHALRLACAFLETPGLAALSPPAATEGSDYFDRIPTDQRHLHAGVRSASPLPALVDLWRKALPAADVGLVEALARRDMARLGYEPAAPAPSRADGLRRLPAYAASAARLAVQALTDAARRQRA